MPINKFTTLLDLSRQAKIITGETATFDGKIQVGIPFSGYPTGVNTATTISLGVVSNQTSVFSGDTGTTVFDVSNPLSPNYNPIFDPYSANTWSNPLFGVYVSGLTLPITPLSADSQTVGPFWTLTQTGYTGEYIIGTQYTGFSLTYSFLNISTISGSTYSGFTNAVQQNFSAGTLDYKGPLDYISSKENISVDGRLITNKITISNGASSATTNYILTQTDSSGNGGWVDLSSVITGICFNTLNVTNLKGCSPITIWDSIQSSGSSSTGILSFAFGNNTISSGDFSHSIGVSNISSGKASNSEGGFYFNGIVEITLPNSATTYSSHAEGILTLSNGQASHAEGINTKSYGDFSHSEGSNTLSIGTGSHAEGDGTIASGSTSHAEGLGSITVGQSSHAEGSNTLSIGTGSHAEGNGTISSGQYSHSEGILTLSSAQGAHSEGYSTSATTDYSHSEGVNTLATGIGSHAEGNGTISSGQYSHSEGILTITSGISSHSEGLATKSIGDFSHSEGFGSISIGQYSHAEGGALFGGTSTYSIGIGSHAEGFGTSATTLGSHSEGWGTIAYESYQHVSGRWNTTGNTNQYFIIGKGTNNTTRSNAFRVDSAGNVYGAGATYNSGADYAEYFESLSGDSIPYGTVVELEDDKIKVCVDSNNAIGVISSNPTLIGNNENGTADEWVGKYEKDDWGRFIMEDYSYEIIDYIDESGNTFTKTITEQRPKLSQNYDPNIEYIPRSQRPEWNVVGLVGQVRVLKNQQIPNRWIKMKDINDDIAIYLIR